MRKHGKTFAQLVEECDGNQQYVGLGNPNSKILLVGKEAAYSGGASGIHGDAKSWKNGKVDYSKRFLPDNYNPTWRQYQKLYNYVVDFLELKNIQKTNGKAEISFVENVFTTELSNLTDFNSNDAKKQPEFDSNLKLRKQLFWRSDYIKGFPVVIICASDRKYIETYQGEVCELFEVEFEREEKIGKGNRLWVHYASEQNETFPKLVIHTRQLTNGASDALIRRIAQLISEFLVENAINVKVDY